MVSDTGSGLGLGACNGITIDRRVQLLLSNLARCSLSLNLSSCDSPHAHTHTHTWTRTHTPKQHLRLANDLQNQRSRPWAPTGSTIVSIATWRWFHAQAPKNSQLKRQCVCGRCVYGAGYARCVRGCVCVVPNGSQRFQQIKVKRKLSIWSFFVQHILFMIPCK